MRFICFCFQICCSSKETGRSTSTEVTKAKKVLNKTTKTNGRRRKKAAQEENQRVQSTQPKKKDSEDSPAQSASVTCKNFHQFR
jgi:hypothetical protein